MDEHLTKMVCGHEIGHDIYLRSLAGAEGLKEFELFRMHDPTELEANIFNGTVIDLVLTVSISAKSSADEKRSSVGMLFNLVYYRYFARN